MKLLRMESGIRENFACGIRNPGKFCLWNSGIQENFACGIRNPGKVCSWNPESGKRLPSESGIREIFACGIRNPGKFCLWNPKSGKFYLVESGILGFGIRITAQGIWNPTNDWNPESKSNWHRLESSTWNPEFYGRGIQNPRLSWIHLHGGWRVRFSSCGRDTKLSSCAVPFLVYYAVQGGTDFWICKWNSRVWTLIQMNATEYCFLVLSQLTIIKSSANMLALRLNLICLYLWCDCGVVCYEKCRLSSFFHIIQVIKYRYKSKIQRGTRM